MTERKTVTVEIRRMTAFGCHVYFVDNEQNSAEHIWDLLDLPNKDKIHTLEIRVVEAGK